MAGRGDFCVRRFTTALNITLMEFRLWDISYGAPCTLLSLADDRLKAQGIAPERVGSPQLMQILLMAPDDAHWE